MLTLTGRSLSLTFPLSPSSSPSFTSGESKYDDDITNDTDDDDEWNAVLAAFQMYNSAYGDRYHLEVTCYSEIIRIKYYFR